MLVVGHQRFPMHPAAYPDGSSNTGRARGLRGHGSVTLRTSCQDLMKVPQRLISQLRDAKVEPGRYILR